MCACVKFCYVKFLIIMDKQQIPVELESTLKKLCEHLHLFLSKTETTLDISQNRFEQVYNVLQPWNLSKQSFLDDYDETTCICDSLKTDTTTAGTAEHSLLDSISKTLSTAQSLLSKNSTTTSKDTNENSKKSNKTSSTSVKQKLTTKSKQTLATPTKSSSTTNQLKDGTSSHNPSCPLFNLDVSARNLSSLSLTDAISITKVPFSLSHTIKYCNKFLANFETETKEIKGKNKLNFLHLLDVQNKKSCAKFEAQYSPSEIFIKYLSALHSYRIKHNDSKTESASWVHYTTVKDIETFHTRRSTIITKESWNIILIFIIEKIVPVLEKSNLDIMEKLYIQKMLKTICNFTQSSIPRVPIFKIHHHDE